MIDMWGFNYTGDYLLQLQRVSIEREKKRGGSFRGSSKGEREAYKA